MKPGKSPPPADANEEVSALIEEMDETLQRLEELTAGEVDTVAGRDGRPFLLRRAQEQLRHSEAAKQAAILNALPAHIALLDTQGRIISVNEAWRRFGSADVLQGPGYGIGVDYLEICDSARGDDASEAHQVAEGIRSVLDGGVKSFSIEYPCHSPTEQRWFLLTVTPLPDDHPNGAVVMHLNISERKREQQRTAALLELSISAEAVDEKTLLQQGLDTVQRLTNSRIGFLHFVSEDQNEIELVTWTTDTLASYCHAAFDRHYPVSAAGIWADSIRLKQPVIINDYATAPDKKGLPEGHAALQRFISLPILEDKLVRMIVGVGNAASDYEERELETVKLFAYDLYRIVQRKRAEEELRARELRYAAVVTSAPNAFVTSDAAGRIVGWNPSAERIFGYAEAEVIGQPLTLLMPQRFQDRHLDGMKRVQSGGERRVIGKAVEVVGRRKDASEFPLELSLAEWTVEEGQFFTGIIYDITERKRIENALRNSEVELKAAQRVARIGNWYLDLGTGAIRWSEEIYRVFDCDPELPPPTYAELGQLLTVASAERMNAAIENSKQTGAPYETDLEVLRADDPNKWIAAHGEVVRDDNGQIVGLRGTAQDISERKAQELKIARLSRIQAVLSGINSLIVRVRDRNELFKETCRIAVEVGAFRMAWIGVIDPQTLDGKVVAWHGGEEGYLDKIRLTARDGAPESERPACRALRQMEPVICNNIATEPSLAALWDDLLRRGHKSAGCFPLTVAGRPEAVIALFAGELNFFDDEETRLLLELAGDISFALDHIEKVERLDYLAYYDVLTGLANRTLFLERLAQYMRSAVSGGHKLAVYLIDLERFKNLNDSLGRPAGDALLRQVTEWLTLNVGDANLLARVGADHFALVMPEVREGGDLARLLEKWIEAFLEHPFRLNDAVFRIAAKVGVALFPDDGADADTLFRNAEAALKKAKASGERYLFYTQTMTEAVAGKLTLENQLRQALDNGEFVLHYQPKVNLASGKMTGAEALIRWNDSRTGLVPPGRFIPILEETGLIYDVGRWALRQAIDDYLRWCAAGLPAVRIAVNVSALQLRNRGFIEEIRQAISIDAQAPAGLELEITESLIMEDVKGTIASLQAIRDLGVSIAIDDFGTGFSSLSYLAKLPVDTLKIDRSFVIDMTAGPEGLGLVSTIINLAHSLKLKVVAEGVETEEQSRLLRLLACDEMQGFLYSKPVPSEIFEASFLTPPPAG